MKNPSSFEFTYNIYGVLLSMREITQNVKCIEFNKDSKSGRQEFESIHVPRAPLEALWQNIFHAKLFDDAIILALSIGYEIDFRNSTFSPDDFRRLLKDEYYEGNIVDLRWLIDDLMAKGATDQISITSVEGLSQAFLLCIAREFFLKNIFGEISYYFAEQIFKKLENSCVDENTLLLLREYTLFEGQVRWWLCEPLQGFAEALAVIYYYKHRKFPENWDDIYSVQIESGHPNPLLYVFTSHEWTIGAFCEISLQEYIRINFEVFVKLNETLANLQIIPERFPDELHEIEFIWLFKSKWTFSAIPCINFNIFRREYLK